jgi:hypothetical protein
MTLPPPFNVIKNFQLFLFFIRNIDEFDRRIKKKSSDKTFLTVKKIIKTFSAAVFFVSKQFSQNFKRYSNRPVRVSNQLLWKTEGYEETFFTYSIWKVWYPLYPKSAAQKVKAKRSAFCNIAVWHSPLVTAFNRWAAFVRQERIWFRTKLNNSCRHVQYS